jgi:hypothetical protein
LYDLLLQDTEGIAPSVLPSYVQERDDIHIGSEGVHYLKTNTVHKRYAVDLDPSALGEFLGEFPSRHSAMLQIEIEQRNGTSRYVSTRVRSASREDLLTVDLKKLLARYDIVVASSPVLVLFAPRDEKWNEGVL